MNGYAPIRDWGSHTSGASRSKARRRRHGTHGICGGCRASFGHLVVRVLGVTPRKGMRPLDGQRRPTSSHNRRRPTGFNHRHNILPSTLRLRLRLVTDSRGALLLVSLQAASSRQLLLSWKQIYRRRSSVRTPVPASRRRAPDWRQCSGCAEKASPLRDCRPPAQSYDPRYVTSFMKLQPLAENRLLWRRRGEREQSDPPER